MKKHNKTLAVYGIHDLDDKPYPVMVHDHNVTLFQKGEILKNIQLERITRKKYDHRLPACFYKLLAEENLLGDKDIDFVFVDHFIGRAFQNSKGNIRFEAPLTNQLKCTPETGVCYYLDGMNDAYAVNHELAHVYSNLPFSGDFKENSLHVHFDGGASKSNFSAWVFKNGRMNLLEYHWDLNYLSSLFNSNALNFSIIGAKQPDQNSMPGKFMGFSSYGSYDPKIERWLKKNDYFQSIWKNKQYFFTKLKEDWNLSLTSFDQKSEFVQNIAATVQHIFQRDLFYKLKELKDRTQAKDLYYSGGSALNIKANTYLCESGLFEDIHIPPCTNDSGLSIGAGALVEWMKHGKVVKHGPYLNNWRLKEQSFSYDQGIIETVTAHLLKGRVIGVCNGFGESGPRALGNRSILALAGSKEIADYVSRSLKGREWYRPIAPVMLSKNLECFTGSTEFSSLAKYMLRDFHIKPDKAKEIEGVVHVDGTSRIQIIQERAENPFIYDLLTHLDQNHQVKALINTSFNAKGRPIVHTEKDALEEAKEMGLELVLLNGRLVQISGKGN
jgi:carbamoyltransferase